ncbi:hypothetical protein [Niabella hirudinis]|uniref:hypothetical protein n=1 Tax=Niabella hirudinis TaxID=1285929 RepID=UPI003EC001BD
MNFTILFVTEANEEYLNSYWWYEQQQEGLGTRFKTKVELTLTKISQNPRAYKYGKRPFREAAFPIYYRI